MPKEKGGKFTDLASISLLFSAWRGFVGKMWYAGMTLLAFCKRFAFLANDKLPLV
jgi:hypothetical protein